MKNIIRPLLFLLFFWVVSSNAHAFDPVLNFSDLISGPDTGLGDGLGSGVIVTIWGQHLGSTISGSTITFTDSANNKHTPAEVYYWRNADGNLPGGPADLYESHKMQELAFSIPDAASGPGTIHVTVNGVDSNTLPFTVRSGTIKHVKSSGSGSGAGTWADPYLTIYEAENDINFAGATVYVHDDIITGTNTSNNTLRFNKAGSSSTVADQYTYTAYPGSTPTVRSSGRAFDMTATTGMVVSKFVFEASNYSVGANGQLVSQRATKNSCITGTKDSRIVGNRCTDTSDGCASQFQGAIVNDSLNGDTIGNLQMLGNEVHDYGCEGSGKLHHTTYFSIRDNLTSSYEPPHIGWNYLHDNHAKNGIHFFDQDTHSDFSGDIHIHDNVITNQGGCGIQVGNTGSVWTNDWYLYNNIIIDTGRASSWNGIDPDTVSGACTSSINIHDGGLSGTVYVFNNTIKKWMDDISFAADKDTRAAMGMQASADLVTVISTNNIYLTDKDYYYLAAGYQAGGQLDNVSGSNNHFYTSAGTQVYAVTPSYDAAVIETDPLLTFNNGGAGPQITAIGGSSDIIGGGVAPPITLSRDIYGTLRSGYDVGAVGFSIGPKSPGNVDAQ